MLFVIESDQRNFLTSVGMPYQVLLCHGAFSVQQMDVFPGALWVSLSTLCHHNAHVCPIHTGRCLQILFAEGLSS